MRLSAFFPALSLAAAAVVPSSLAVTFSDLCGKPWRKTVPALSLSGNMTVFNFSRVAMPRDSRLIVRDPSEGPSRPQFGAIEPDTDECSWAFFSRWDSITLDYVPPEVACSNASAFGVTIDVMDTATFCRNDTGFFSEGCGSFPAGVTTSTRWGDDTCAKGKPGWQESPLDKEVDGCKRELVTKAFDATASAWSVVFEELEIVRSGRLVVEGLRGASGDSTNSSEPPVHTVVPMEKCTWSFVVNAPGILSVIFVKTNLTEIPPGLLSAEFPPTLDDIELCETNLTALPANVDEIWSDMYYVFVERSRLTAFPEALTRMRVVQLSLSGNSISTIPREFLCGRELQELHVSSNPIAWLPGDDEVQGCAGGGPRVGRLGLVDTRVAALPSWTTSGGTRVQAYGSPLCAGGTNGSAEVSRGSGVDCSAAEALQYPLYLIESE
ncbi:hypothetical protein P43SY_009887 [Pythium insidiosum]|uniref:TKL protein kinase n=1 Tax=Pythium insidiosum TaxID=114742 RepID=A0AAD5M3W6_PYTIN|nr:hypothetical protein P43SY_009887 [Pythium insidiosum]